METGRGQRCWLFDRLLRPSEPGEALERRTPCRPRHAPRTSGWYRHIFLVARLQVERPLVAGADDAVLEDDALHELRRDGCRCSAARRPVVVQNSTTGVPTSITRLRALAAPARPSPLDPVVHSPPSGVLRQIVYRSRACSKAQDPSWRNTAPDEAARRGHRVGSTGRRRRRRGDPFRRHARSTAPWPQRWPRRCCRRSGSVAT